MASAELLCLGQIGDVTCIQKMCYRQSTRFHRTELQSGSRVGARFAMLRSVRRRLTFVSNEILHRASLVNQRDLAETATIFARHADLLIDGDHPIESTVIEEYWVACRCRWKSWSASGQAGKTFSELSQLAEEIMVAEMPTRVWTALYYVHCMVHQNSEGLRLVRQTLQWHVEARQTTLQQLIDDYQRTELSGLLRLDRVRRRVERWTDFLIGTITRHGVALHLAFDPDRCRNNAESMQDGPTAEAVWPLTIAGLTRSFSTVPHFSEESARSHTAVLKAQLAAFPAGAFRNDGRPLSGPLNRVVQKLLDRIPLSPHGAN